MTITVVNLRKQEADFKCDRPSPLGNPFYMRSEHERHTVCNQYETLFQKYLNPDLAPVGWLEYLDKILQAAKEKNITLGCWCAPKRCHCDTIKTYLEVELNADIGKS